MKNSQGTPGRPRHIPTDIDRRVVLLLASQGTPQPQIACAVNVSEKTLRRHYRHELDVGAVRLESALILRLYSLAGGKGATALKATVFALRCRFGWSPYAPPPPRG